MNDAVQNGTRRGARAATNLQDAHAWTKWKRLDDRG